MGSVTIYYLRQLLHINWPGFPLNMLGPFGSFAGVICVGGGVCVAGGSLCFHVIPNTEIAAMKHI